MTTKNSAKKILVSLLVGLFSFSSLGVALAHPFAPPGGPRPGPGSGPRSGPSSGPRPGLSSRSGSSLAPGAVRPNPGSSSGTIAPGAVRPNPGSSINQTAPGTMRPYQHPRLHPNMPQVNPMPIPDTYAHNPGGPRMWPGGRPPMGPGPQRSPYWGYSNPYPHWRRSGIAFHFGWSRPYYWWGCRRGITFGEYLLLGLMIEAMRNSHPHNIDDLYSEHLSGASYEDLCRRYDVDWVTINSQARLRYDEMGAYARGEGISFWAWGDRISY